MAVSTLCQRSERDTRKDAKWYVDKDTNDINIGITEKYEQECTGGSEDLSLHICTSRLYNIYYNVKIKHFPELF